MGVNEPEGVANLDPGAWLADLHEKMRCIAKYRSCGSHGFREENVF